MLACRVVGGRGRRFVTRHKSKVGNMAGNEYILTPEGKTMLRNFIERT